MKFRLLFGTLLLCLAAHAHAEVFFYELEGYFTRHTVGADIEAQIPESFAPGESFTGWIAYDTNRFLVTEDGWSYPAPIAGFYLENQYRQVIAGSDISSSISPGRAADLEGVTFSLLANTEYFTIAGAPYHGRISFSWVSTGTGQLPVEPSEDPDDYVPGRLQPDSWTFEVVNTGQCPNFCDPQQVSTLTGHITRLGPPRPRTSYFEAFYTQGAVSEWTTQGGSWVVEPGQYRNVANTSLTSSVYTGLPLTTSYTVNTRLYSQWSGSGNTLGLLLHYRDSANFDEIRFNVQGAVTYTRVTQGKRSVLQTGTYPGGGPRTSLGVSTQRAGNNLVLRVDDQEVFNVNVGTLEGGFAGLFASWNQARFSQFQMWLERGWQLSSSHFNGSAEGWTPVAGTWMPVDDYYYSSSNIAAAVSTSAPISSNDYAVQASMYLEWSNSGNRGGLVYDYVDQSNYRAVLVSASREAQGGNPAQIEILEVVNGVRRIVDSTSGGSNQVLPRQWSPLAIRRLGNLTEVTVSGITGYFNQPIVNGTKRVGLIASYNKVRFDQVLVGVSR